MSEYVYVWVHSDDNTQYGLLKKMCADFTIGLLVSVNRSLSGFQCPLEIAVGTYKCVQELLLLQWKSSPTPTSCSFPSLIGRPATFSVARRKVIGPNV